jgi:hypothetical protein
MANCNHLLGVFYCLEVDEEASLAHGKVAFYARPAPVITMCRLCNAVLDILPTGEPNEP